MGFASLPNGTASLPVEAKIWTSDDILMCNSYVPEIGWRHVDDAERNRLVFVYFWITTGTESRAVADGDLVRCSTIFLPGESS
jgi:hypothetical protein